MNLYGQLYNLEINLIKMSSEEKELLNSIWNELGMIYKLMEKNFKEIIKLLSDIQRNMR
ncbi:hypothetical protein LCGC14_0960140 [marine sediment metagenome]|uniref:Uncharacterized protein n=1 Tax=marine sediment metagenome TaxID=412755 RepID=A0A0F9NER0_9ZZZZ